MEKFYLLECLLPKLTEQPLKCPGSNYESSPLIMIFWGCESIIVHWQMAQSHKSLVDLNIHSDNWQMIPNFNSKSHFDLNTCTGNWFQILNDKSCFDLGILTDMNNDRRFQISSDKSCFDLNILTNNWHLIPNFISQVLGVSNGPIQFKSARKIWPSLELLAKIGWVLACSCSLNFCNRSHTWILVKMC